MSTLAELDQQVADIRKVVLADRDFRQLSGGQAVTDEARARAAINAYPHAEVPPSAVAVAAVVSLMEAVRAESAEISLRAWLVGHILPVFVSKGSTGEGEVSTAIWYANEAIRQLKQ